MKEKDYEVMEEIVHLREVRNKLMEDYRDYPWENDILNIVRERRTELETSFIADVKGR